MIWNCPNCGKRLEFSGEQLGETRGVVVCPQCLSSDKVPGYDAPRAKTREKAKQQEPRQGATSTARGSAPPTQQPARSMSTPPAHKSKPTPPPHRSKISFSDNTSPSADTPPVKPKNSGKKKGKSKSSHRGCLAPRSPWGCLWRTVVYTLILLVVYIVFGMLLQGI